MEAEEEKMTADMEEMMGADGDEEKMIAEVMRHLDQESTQGVYRMSVTFDDSEQGKEVSHKCCHMYGRPASETVGLLDMYTDISGETPDRE